MLKQNTHVRLAGMMFFYWGAMSTLAFHVLLLQQSGLNSTQVGFVTAANAVVGMIAPPLWARRADRSRNIKRVLLCAFLLWAVCNALLPFANGVWLWALPLSAVLLPCLMFFRAPSSALLDGIVVQGARRAHIPFARFRLWGSLGYACVVSLSAFLLRRTSMFVPYFISTAVAVPLLWMLFRQPVASQEKTIPPAQKGFHPGASFFLFLLFNTALYMASNATSTFTPYLLADMNLEPTLFSTFAGLKTFLEIPALYLASRWTQPKAMRATLCLSGLFYLTEQTLYPLAGQSWHVLSLQCLEGVAFGLYLSAAAPYVAHITAVQWTATAQSWVTTTLFLGSILSSLLGSLFSGWWGVRSVFVLTAVTLGISLLCFLFRRRREME